MSPNSQNVDLFIAAVGMRDPESEAGPTGPLRGALELQPARTVLIALPGVEEQAQRTRDRIAADVPATDVSIEKLSVADPVDLDALLHACGRLLDRLLAAFTADAAVAVCASSGTPQIGLALTLAATARAPAALHFQALDPAKTDRPWRPFDPDALRHHAELDAAFQLLSSCRYAEAAGLLRRRALSASTEARSRRPAIRAALALAEAIDVANALRPVDAATALQGASMKALPDDVVDGWRALAGWYGGVRGQKAEANPNWPVELAARACRERAAGRNAEALVAAAIAFEVAIAVRLRTLPGEGLDPDALSLADRGRLPTDIRQDLRPRKDTDPPVYRVEGAQRRSELLRSLDPAYAPLFADTRCERLVNRRNLLVHAAKRPSEEDVRASLEFLSDLCRAFGWTDPAACASSPDALSRLTGALRGAAGLG